MSSKADSLICKICASEVTFVFNKSWGKQFSLMPYYQCTNPQCNFLHTDYLDNLSEEEVSKMYDEHTFADSKGRANLPLDKVNLAKVILPDVNKVLDIGCGEGYGVSTLRQAGFEAYGYDVMSPKVCNQYITTGSLNSITGTYDVITAIEVLEHLADPIDVCNRIARHVKKGGIFAFSTHTFEPNKHDANWWYLDIIGHISLHTRSSLRLLAEMTGFQVVTDVFATHVWIRDDSVPVGAATRIKTKHILNKLFDSRSYKIVLNRMKTTSASITTPFK